MIIRRWEWKQLAKDMSSQEFVVLSICYLFISCQCPLSNIYSYVKSSVSNIEIEMSRLD